MARVGLLLQGTSASLVTRLEGFQQGLRDRGYVEGKNIVLEQRFDDDKEQQLPALAADLVRLRVDIIVAAATSAVMTAKQVTAAIPTIIVHSADPVALGLVSSLARPGGNWRQRIGCQQYTQQRNLSRLGALWHMARISRTLIGGPPFSWTRSKGEPSPLICP